MRSLISYLSPANFSLREGCKVVYHRLPWKEPSTPYLLDVLYEDDDIVNTFFFGLKKCFFSFLVHLRLTFEFDVMESQVAVIKPSGLQVLPGGLFQQRTVLTQLQWRDWRVTTSSPLCTKQSASQAHPVPVHRLGRGTSGLFELQISDLMDSVPCNPSVRFRLGASF